MDWPHGVTRELIELLLAERRAEAARERLFLAHDVAPAPVRVAIGRALAWLGARIRFRTLTRRRADASV
jgi:hypothetical protein